MTKAYLINNKIALDVEDIIDIAADAVANVKTNGIINVIQGQFCGQYNEKEDKYIGDFSTEDGRQFMVYQGGCLEWYDFEPDEDVQLEGERASSPGACQYK